MADTLPAAFASPTPGGKYALKQVYRDPIARKAYVFFVDANTGGVLDSLNGYTLWEGGLGFGTPQGGTGGTSGGGAPAQEPSRFADPNTSEIRNDGFDNPQSGFNSDNLYNRGGGNSNSTMGNSTPTQTIRSQDFGNGVGRIIVEGAGSATPGTYNVNTPSQMGRVPNDIVSGTRQTDGVSQSFNPANPTAGYSFGPAPTSTANISNPGQLQGYFGRNTNEVPKEVWAGYIAQEAAKRGINPEVAVAVARAEALNDLGYKTANLQATAPYQGQRERSFGALQIHAGPRNNVHYSDFKATTGFELDDPRVEVEMARIQYGLDMAAKAGSWKDWANTSGKLFGDRAARVGLENAQPMGVSVTAEVVSGGLLSGTTNSFGREDTGYGISQPSSNRFEGSSAPSVQSQSLMDFTGMTELQGRVANAGYSLADVGQFTRNDSGTPLSEEGVGYRAGVGFGPYDQPAQPQRTFTPEIPSFANTNDFYGKERGTSRIGNNPTTGDEFAVARNNEVQTQNIFSQGPISERTLSGPSIANQTPSFGQPPSGPIDYNNVGAGSVVFSAESLQANAKTGQVVTQGPVSVVISDVLPGNAGFYLKDQNVNFIYDSKTNKGVVVPNDKASVQMATVANGLLAAKGTLDLGYVKENGIRVATPSQIAWDMMANANKYKDMVVSPEETRKAMQEVGPKSYVDQVPQMEESSIEGLRAQAAQNQAILADMNIPNAVVDPSTGRVSITANATSPVRDPSLNWQGVAAPKPDILDYEAIAPYNPAFDEGYGKLVSGGFGSYTGAGKARSEAEKVAAAFAETNYGIEMDSGMPGAIGMPSYGFASAGPNLSGISPVQSNFDWSGGYTGRGGSAQSTLGMDSPRETNAASLGSGAGFGNKDGGKVAEQTRQAEAARKAEVERQAEAQREYERGMARAEQTRQAEAARQAEVARQQEANRQAELSRQAEAARQASGGGYTGGGPTGGGRSSGGGREGDSTTGWGGGSGQTGGRADRDQQGFSGGNSGYAVDSGRGAGGRGGSSPSTGSGGTGGQGGPGPAGGSGGFGFGGGSQGGYNGTDGGRR